MCGQLADYISESLAIGQGLRLLQIQIEGSNRGK